LQKNTNARANKSPAFSIFFPKEPVKFGSADGNEQLWVRPVSLAEALQQAAKLPLAAYRLGGTGQGCQLN
jgi:hypothetical protein